MRTTDAGGREAGRREGGRPSIYDVAEVAGVSHQTVSRVLNGHTNIRESTRERVQRAIEEVGYTRNSIARALATSRTKRIGVLVDSAVEFGPGSTVRGVEAAARATGYTVTTASVGEDARSGVGDGVEYLMTQGVEAMCVIAPRSSSLAALRESSPRVPTLVVAADAGDGILSVSVDQRKGASEAVQHLVDQGHTRIRHLAGPLDWLDARERERAWRSTLERAGIEIVEPGVGDWSSDAGYRYALESPDLGTGTAVFVANDQMALGVIHGLHDRGLRVPEDVSVVGFDDLPDARHFLPPLTTVRQDFHALGATILRLLVRALERDGSVDGATTPAELVVRESTAPPRGSTPD